MKASHEFKNLLTTILGYAELLQRRLPAGDPRRGYADEIARAAERARVLSAELFAHRETAAPAVPADAKPAEPAPH